MAAGVQPTRGEVAVGLFTVGYVLAFTALFLARGNIEFVVYVGTMLVMLWLVARNLRRAEFPLALLWALSLWGLAHMAGGGVVVNGAVLYALPLLPIVSDGEMTILKYDQLVHAWGFGVTAWLLWHLMVQAHPQLRGTATAAVYPVLGAMGLGALNEIIEFTAVLTVPDTNVGGYLNTALDLVFNGLGAVIAMALILWRERRRRAAP